jgi:glycosyltransferase involved in cell wall biosynthesis
MATLGGSLFVRNAIKYDYCVKEAIASLADLCDEVFILDCQSDDGTDTMLAEYLEKFPNVTYQTNGDWNCKPDYFKLSELANMCIAKLKTDWHFMLQADEVIHESSFAAVRRLIAQPTKGKKTIAVRRLNLFGTPDKHISLTLPSKPCSDQPVRIGTRGTIAKGDAESLEWSNTDRQHIDQVLIYHYGYVRKAEINISKAIDMQSWFNGPKSGVDGRLLEMQKTGKWEPYKLIAESGLTPIPVPHPKYSAEWAKERNSE